MPPPPRVGRRAPIARVLGPRASEFLARLPLALSVPVVLALGLVVSGSGVTYASTNFAHTVEWIRNAEQGNVLQQSITYEPGEEMIYHQVPVDGRLGTTSLVSRVGSQAGTVLLLPEDPAYRGNLGYRSEWQSGFYSDEGGHYAYGASYYLPDDWNQGSNPRTFDDRLIFQFHEGNGRSPTFSLHLDAGRNQFFVRHMRDSGRFERLWATEIETNTWYDFAFRARWSRSNDGFFQVYLDGRLVHHFTGRTLNDGKRVYTKWGIYGQPTRYMVDEVHIVEGVDALHDATPATVATLMDAIPDHGFGLVRFSGGSNEDLVQTSGCPNSAMFWFTLDGALVWFNANAPDFVNARWDQLFAGQLPRNTLLIATCARA